MKQTCRVLTFDFATAVGLEELQSFDTDCNTHRMHRSHTRVAFVIESVDDSWPDMFELADTVDKTRLLV
jgi:hypothetical protein